MVDNKALLQQFADNERMFEAVRERILNELDLNKLLLNNNDELFEDVRGKLEGRKQIEAAFISIKRLKSLPEKPSKPNGGR